MNVEREGHRVTSLGFYGAVFLVAVLSYRIVEPFLTEIGWAVILAICAAPAQARLSRRLGTSRSAAYLTLMTLFVLILPLMLAGYLLVGETSQLANDVQARLAARGGPMGFFHLVWSWLRARLWYLPSEEAAVEHLSSRLREIAADSARNAGHVVVQAVGFVFSLAITLCILFFMLKDGPAVVRGVRRLLPFGPERNERLIALIHDIVAASVTSTLVIALLQGILGGLTFLLLGVPAPLFWGCTMAVLAVLPAVGATLVWAPAALWLAISGSFMKGVILALVGVLILGNTDNVVRPLMLSGKSRMSTLVLIISLLGGVAAFGFIGVVLGPVVAAVLTGLVNTYALVPDVEPEPPMRPP
jgi:predicted PurR-regulated permease PerM